MNKEQAKALRTLVTKADYARGTSEFEKHASALMLYLSAILDGFPANNTHIAQIPTVFEKNPRLKQAHERDNSLARELRGLNDYVQQ